MTCSRISDQARLRDNASEIPEERMSKSQFTDEHMVKIVRKPASLWRGRSPIIAPTTGHNSRASAVQAGATARAPIAHSRRGDPQNTDMPPRVSTFGRLSVTKSIAQSRSTTLRRMTDARS